MFLAEEFLCDNNGKIRVNHVDSIINKEINFTNMQKVHVFG